MQILCDSLVTLIYQGTKLDEGPLSLLSRIRASPTLHRLCTDFGTEDQRRKSEVIAMLKTRYCPNVYFFRNSIFQNFLNFLKKK